MILHGLGMRVPNLAQLSFIRRKSFRHIHSPEPQPSALTNPCAADEAGELAKESGAGGPDVCPPMGSTISIRDRGARSMTRLLSFRQKQNPLTFIPSPRLVLCGFLAIVWLLRSVSAGEPPSPVEYHIRRWTTEDGLPEHRFNAIAQTPDGYIWIAQWSGLVRFDGAQFVVFNRNNTPALTDDTINSLATDRQGRLWLGTHQGLVRYDQGQFSRVAEPSQLPDRKIWQVLITRDDQVLLRTEREVGAWHNGQFSSLITDEREPPIFRGLQIAHEGQDDQLLLLTRDGLLKYNPVDCSFAPMEIPPTPFVGGWGCALYDRDHALWISTGGPPLARFYKGKWTEPLREHPSEGDAITWLGLDSHGTLWVNLRQKGLHRWNKGALQPFLPNGEPAPREVSSMFEDRDGNLWLGTGDGLFCLHPKAFRAFTQRDGLPGAVCEVVAEAPDGSIWVGTERGLAQIVNGQVRSVPMPATERYCGVRSVLTTSEGTVWFTIAGRGLSRVEAGNCSRVVGEQEPGFWTASALAQLNNGALLIGNGNGLACWEEGELSVWLDFRDGSHWGTRAMLVDRQSNLWLGTHARGLVLMRPSGAAGTFKPTHTAYEFASLFTTEDGLADNSIRAIYQDATDALWIGTENGLSRLIPAAGGEARNLTLNQSSQGQGSRTSSPAKTFAGRFTFRAAQGLPENEVNSIVEDDLGYLWLGGARGIHRLRRQELEAVAEGEVASARSITFGELDGLESAETSSDGQSAACKASDGRLWFCTARGVAVVNPRDALQFENPVRVLVEQVKVDADLLALESPSTGPRRLPARPGVVGIQFTANSFLSPERVRFRYRLRGHDLRWREARSSERQGFYPNLKPGEYNFEVRACNSHGYWNERATSFPFSIPRSFTQTFWFPSLCAGGLLALSGALAIWRLRWQRRVLMAEQSTALERERSRIARDLHDNLGTALTGLALEADVSCRRNPGGSDRTLERISANSRAMADRMREVVWAINPSCDDADNLAGFLAQYADQFLGAAGLRCRLDLPVELEKISLRAEARYQLFAAVKEALHNVVKHSRASQVEISIVCLQGQLRLELHDNGIGFSGSESPSDGSGLRNIRERLAGLGGSLSIESSPRSGTRLVFSIPLVPPESYK